MSFLYDKISNARTYWDKKTCSCPEEWNEKIAKSSTVYVGNLAFTTPEERIHEVLQAAGEIERIVLGLNSIQKSPCGFAFVVYKDIKSAKRAVGMFKGCVIDGRVIRVDADPGDNIDTERRLARGINGYQWRDAFRKEFDTSRGGQGLGVDHETLNHNPKVHQSASTTLLP
ncbi:nuclear cap binding protein family member protein [Theileria equi strain WA]|uniref:Nuclear cap-binding protein subunit 2 n=1 Tax=Theileria equi strain WA TaxID=1537102 RepID=L1LFR9_THEEQ|nr:nuclear cap binding protein family member protein [Theileria equi strain WA]EKX74110.1 nuclear cap binding protein family member protein [Theileria equi strain WA]|eukprot:XP_004833562.1 nuclear cap binding protein family member protein [Theileria equi strain WA]